LAQSAAIREANVGDRGWWVELLKWSLSGIVMTAVMAWLARYRMRAAGGREPGRLVQPVSMLIIGLAGVAFFGGIAIVSNLYPNKTVTWLTTTVFMGFALLSLPCITIYFTDNHRLSREGLSFTTFYGARRFIAWSDVTAVRYAPTLKWFRVESRTGTVARLSAMLVGLPEFALAALKHVPGPAFDPETAEILDATASGDPPPLW
jgi:hypothetical protein